MDPTIWIAVLVLVLAISMTCVKIGSAALRMTGLDQETASFQALSAFTGTGFTTREAETITKDRRRRRIAKTLMISGNVGLAVSLVALFQVAQGDPLERFDQDYESQAKFRAGVLFIVAVIGLIFLYNLAFGKRLNRWLTRFIERRLERSTDLAMPHFEHVLRLGRGYGISEIHIREGHPAMGKTLLDLGWGPKGVLVLAIERGSELVSGPTAATEILEGDEIVCYGPTEKIRRIAAEKSPEDTGAHPKEKESAD
jgi:hypothetical protein